MGGYVPRRGQARCIAKANRLRCERLIGEFSLSIEKAQGARRDTSPHGGEKSEPTKADVLARAGIPTQDASRFERIAKVPAATFVGLGLVANALLRRRRLE